MFRFLTVWLVSPPPCPLLFARISFHLCVCVQYPSSLRTLNVSVGAFVCRTGGELNSFRETLIIEILWCVCVRGKNAYMFPCNYRLVETPKCLEMDRHMACGAMDAKNVHKNLSHPTTFTLFIPVHRSEFAQIYVCVLCEYCRAKVKRVNVCVTYVKRRNAKH